MNTLTIVLPALLTFLAGLVGVRIGLRQIRLQKEYDFIEKQLKELYSPLVGLRQSIRAKSGLRAKLSNLTNEAWLEICERYKDHPQWNHDKAFGPFSRLIDYDNKQFHTELIPQYEDMLRLLRDNMWLAEPATRNWFPELLIFVEIWHRWLDKSLPVEVLQKIDHSESRLDGFYKHIEETLDHLRSKLPRGRRDQRSVVGWFRMKQKAGNTS